MAISLLLLLPLLPLASSHALSVLSGDSIDFQCQIETKEDILYEPEFQKLEDGSWTTLFTGDAPRPTTEVTKWIVDQDVAGVFHYRLKTATLADGGEYRCKNVNMRLHGLSVISGDVDCGSADAALDQPIERVEDFKPRCRIQTTGPKTEDAPTLQWVVGSHDDIEKNLTSEALLDLQGLLGSDLHGKTISCFLAGEIPSHLTRPSCVLGPLNVAFDVKVKEVNSEVDNGCSDVQIILHGNPVPLMPLVTIGASVEGAVESGVEANGDDVIVHLHACNLFKPVLVDVLYDNVVVKSLTMDSTQRIIENPDVAPADSSATIVVVIVVLVFVIVAAVVAALVFKRKTAGLKQLDEETAENSVEDKEGKEGETSADDVVADEVKIPLGDGVEAEEIKEELKEKVADVEEPAKTADAETGEVADVEAAVTEAKLDDADPKLADVEVKLADAEGSSTNLLEVDGVKMIDDSLNESKGEENVNV